MKIVNRQKSKLPEFFKYILWSYKFEDINPGEDMERIIINTVNYGDWGHWQWIIGYYGKAKVKTLIENTPASEFRERALKLIQILLDIKKIKYASRGVKIRAEKNL